MIFTIDTIFFRFLNTEILKNVVKCCQKQKLSCEFFIYWYKIFISHKKLDVVGRWLKGQIRFSFWWHFTRIDFHGRHVSMKLVHLLSTLFGKGFGITISWDRVPQDKVYIKLFLVALLHRKRQKLLRASLHWSNILPYF